MVIFGRGEVVSGQVVSVLRQVSLTKRHVEEGVVTLLPMDSRVGMLDGMPGAPAAHQWHRARVCLKTSPILRGVN